MKKAGKGEYILNNVILKNKAVFIMILMALVIGAIEPIFFSTNNLFNVLRQVCSSTILAMGFTFILGLGEIDLSVGAILGLNGVIMAKLMVEMNWPIATAILVAVVAGLVFGVVNATIISLLDIPPFIVTLATQSLFRGAVYIITGMVPIAGLPDSFINIGQGYVGRVPIPVVIMLVVIVISYILANLLNLWKTRYCNGRKCRCNKGLRNQYKACSIRRIYAFGCMCYDFCGSDNCQSCIGADCCR